ncbi:MAG: tetratricopeptide repeat protein [Desulfuromonadaceae bacterium]|nr:tetratricopeptide repeat protein [Desulfuromonadaceae bacterium]
MKNHPGMEAMGLSALSDTNLSQREKSGMEKQPVENLLALAASHLEQGNIPLAKIHYLSALKKQPDLAIAWAGLARAFEIEGKQDQAVKVLETGRKSSPDSAVLLAALGRLERNRGNLEASLASLEKAAALAENNSDVLEELAITHDLLGRMENAEPLYRKVIELEPRRASAHNNLGLNYILQKRYGEAIPLFLQALRLDNMNKRYLNNLASAYALNGDERRALAAFGLATDRAAAYNNLGCIYMSEQKWDQAENAFKNALDAKPSFYLKAHENLEQIKKMRALSD